MKTTPSSKCIARILAALAAAALVGTARADLTQIANSANVATWNTENGASPFYTTSLSGLSGQGTVTVSNSATTTVLSETFTITNGAGGLTATTGATNYVLTGVGLILGGEAASANYLSLFDVTTNLTSNNGTVLQGSGAMYTDTTGNLLGNGAGLNISDPLGSSEQVSLFFNRGTNSQDWVVLQTNHTYALEIAVPSTGGSITWSRSSNADPGGQAMGRHNGAYTGPNTTNLTLASLGAAGGAPRTFAVALYGFATAAPGTVNASAPSTNGTIQYIVDDFVPNGVTNGNPTNYDYYEADTNNTAYSNGNITNVWGNWFGDGSTTATWDGTTDAQGNAASGSMIVGMNCNQNNQLEMWDQGSGNNFEALNVNGFIYSNFECDVKFDPTSALQTNTNNNTVSYGVLQFGTRASTYAQDYFNGVVIVPQGSNGWTHVKIGLLPSTDANEANIQGFLIHLYTPFGGPPALIGQLKMWVDNIKFTGSAAPLVIPPPTMAISPAVPSLRIFAGTGGQYDRQELVTLDQNQSWVTATAGSPVTYSFTLLSTPALAGFQTHMFLVPTNSLPTGNAITGNIYFEYQASNDCWLQINGQANGGVNYNVAWKTNLPNNNPNNVVLNVTNNTPGSGVGTWIVKFTSASSGTLTAPNAATGGRSPSRTRTSQPTLAIS